MNITLYTILSLTITEFQWLLEVNFTHNFIGKFVYIVPNTFSTGRHNYLRALVAKQPQAKSVGTHHRGSRSQTITEEYIWMQAGWQARPDATLDSIVAALHSFIHAVLLFRYIQHIYECIYIYISTYHTVWLINGSIHARQSKKAHSGSACIHAYNALRRRR